MDDYYEVKTQLLCTLGDTLACAEQKWWMLRALLGETWDAVAKDCHYQAHAWPLDSVEDVLNAIEMSLLYSLIQADLATQIRALHPKTLVDAVRLATELSAVSPRHSYRHKWRNPHDDRSTQERTNPKPQWSR